METYKDAKLTRKDYNVIIKLEKILQKSFYHYDFINDPDSFRKFKYLSIKNYLV